MNYIWKTLLLLSLFSCKKSNSNINYSSYKEYCENIFLIFEQCQNDLLQEKHNDLNQCIIDYVQEETIPNGDKIFTSLLTYESPNPGLNRVSFNQISYKEFKELTVNQIEETFVVSLEGGHNLRFTFSQILEKKSLKKKYKGVLEITSIQTGANYDLNPRLRLTILIGKK